MLEKHPTKDRLCVPDVFASDPNFTPQKCKSIFGFVGVCISQCVPQVKNAEVPLPQSTCPKGQLCSPCYDPRTLLETGACSMGALACQGKPPHPKDGVCKDYEPTLDVSGFPKCCPDGEAHCAGPKLVGEKDRARLAKCAGGKSFCVPDKLLKRGGKYTFKKCKSVGNTEGRCLSVCLPEIISQLDLLPISSCDKGERCAPCYDPRSGKATGACSQGYCEKGPTEPPPGQGGNAKILIRLWICRNLQNAAQKVALIVQNQT